IDKKNELGLQFLLDSGKPGRTVLLRGDMDALPIQEPEGCEFRSQVSGVMHACGHDLNTCFVTGCAIVLNNNKDLLKGKVKFVWQCAEETLQGAKAAIEYGVLDGVEPAFCFGFHGYSDNPAGKIGIRQGNCLAASDTVHIKVRGKGGHAAAPHQTIDPVVISAHVILAIQTLAARYHRPWDPLVITIGMVHGGTACNITPEEVELTGTMRTFDAELRAKLPQLLESTCRGQAQAFGGDCEVVVEQLCPSIVVSQECFEAADSALKLGIGAEHIAYPDYPTMGSEDFGFFVQRYPGMQIQVGTASDDPRSQGPFHDPAITFNEDSIYWGVAAGCSLALGIC
ncbi:MAG: amidohydrolase, partial [Firmicutes bacterium]|nr:amidohydrolase [Bacillota bacterium]